MTDNPTGDTPTAITAADWRRINGTLNTMPYTGWVARSARVASVDDLLAWLRRYSEALDELADAAETAELELIEHRRFVADARRVFGVLVNSDPVDQAEAATASHPPKGDPPAAVGPNTPLKD